jgi:hypothetical protein
MAQGLKSRWLRTPCALLTALLLYGLAGSLHAAEQEARVVMLYGLDSYLPPFLAMDKAMRAQLAADTDRPITFFAESLDSQRFAMEALEAEQAALLAKKYRGLRVDVVVAVSRTALQFFERQGARLWPGARVVAPAGPARQSESRAKGTRPQRVRERPGVHYACPSLAARRGARGATCTRNPCDNGRATGCRR